MHPGGAIPEAPTRLGRPLESTWHFLLNPARGRTPSFLARWSNVNRGEEGPILEVNMATMFLSIVCVVAASILTTSTAIAGSRYEYYAPYPRTPQYAPHPRTYQYAPYPGGYQYAPYRGAYHYAPPTNYAPGTSGYLALPPAYYEQPEPVWVPLRPSSCGRYHFWNGQYCADARYHPPYLGPKW